MNLYLFKLQSINIYNLPLALFHLSVKDSIFHPCKFTLTQNGMIELLPGDFVRSYTNNLKQNFRRIDWSMQINELKDSIDLAAQQNQFVAIGTYLDDQLTILKNNFDFATTIDISYNSNEEYNILLKSLAKQHIHLLKNDLLPKEPIDIELLQTKSNFELIKEYANAFDKLNLIKKLEYSTCDYTIPLTSLFDKDSLVSVFANFKIDLSTEALAFYDLWYCNNHLDLH